MVLVLSLAIVFAFSFAALAKGGASLAVKLKPKHPKAGAKYTLIIKGTAKQGSLGSQRNRSEVDRIEQLGGSCASTPQAELAKSGIVDLGPVFVKKGKFKIKQKRLATSASHTTIRFCVYLSSNINKLDAKASKAYTTK